MIRIVLLGRTGNHLFQYALGRVLAEKHGVPLILDASWFNAEGWSEVSHFLKLPIKAKVVRRLPLAARALRRLTGKHYWEYRGIPVLRENPQDQSYDAEFLTAPRDCMLFGYFQTPLYFDGMALELHRELTRLLGDAYQKQAKNGPVPLAGLVDALRKPQSVAIHVRRTDYLTHPVFQVCGDSYYQAAVARMRSHTPGARFFVFSDDPEWCRSHFTDADQVIVDSGSHSPNPLHDLYLMSLASHHIIANSTYSWWSAWLADKPGQQVLMPDRWYARDIRAPIEEKRLPHWEIV